MCTFVNETDSGHGSHISFFICSLNGRKLFCKGHTDIFLYHLHFQIPEELLLFHIIRYKKASPGPAKMQQNPDHSMSQGAVLGGHLIEWWDLDFIAHNEMERTICDLNKKRNSLALCLVYYGVVSLSGWVRKFSTQQRNWLKYKVNRKTL